MPNFETLTFRNYIGTKSDSWSITWTVKMVTENWFDAEFKALFEKHLIFSNFNEQETHFLYWTKSKYFPSCDLLTITSGNVFSGNVQYRIVYLRTTLCYIS